MLVVPPFRPLITSRADRNACGGWLRLPILIAALGLVAIAPSHARAVDAALTAVRASDPRVVDGAGTEWSADLRTLGDSGVEAAAAIEDATLVVCIVFSDPMQRNRLMAGGLELSIAPSTDPEQKILRYPIGAVRPGPGEQRGERLSADEIRARFEANVEQVEWKNPSGERFPATRDQLGDLQVAAQPGQGVFTYEVRIPLAAGAWGADVEDGDTVVVSLKSPRRSAIRSRDDQGGRGGGGRESAGRGGGGMRGGRPGGGGPRGGGPGGGGPGGGNRPQPIEVVLEIELPSDWR